MPIKGPVSTLDTVVQHTFRLTFREQRMVSFLLLFILHPWDTQGDEQFAVKIAIDFSVKIIVLCDTANSFYVAI